MIARGVKLCATKLGLPAQRPVSKGSGRTRSLGKKARVHLELPDIIIWREDVQGVNGGCAQKKRGGGGEGVESPRRCKKGQEAMMLPSKLPAEDDPVTVAT